MQKISFRFLRYCIVGTLGTILDIAIVYALFHSLGMNIFFATAIGFFVASIHNFLWNKIWTFQDNSRKFLRQYMKFFMISGIGLALSLACMYLFFSILGFSVIFAKMCTSWCVLIWNFLGNHFWTFAKNNIRPYHENHEKIIKNMISIVIPAYNEEERIEKTLHEVNDFFTKNQIIYEIIVVDDGSSDGTANLIKRNFKNINIVSLKKNSGKGYALKKWVEKAVWEYVLLYDADGSTPIIEVQKMLDVKEKFDCVIASRYMDSSIIVEKQSKYRTFISRFGNAMINLVLLEKIHDTQCGCKLLLTSKAKYLFSLQKIKRWWFDIELLFLAQKAWFSLVEIPIVWTNDTWSKFRAFRDSIKTFLELIYIKFYAWFGFYK